VVVRVTPKQQQARRRELHAMSTANLRKLYVKLSGHLMSEAKAMLSGLSDEGRQIMIDSIIHHEANS
jgi:hypothetical protein